MRGHLLQCEQASADWEGLNAQHKERTSDPARLWKNRDVDPEMKSAMDSLKFHRDAAILYATVISAESAAREILHG